MQERIRGNNGGFTLIEMMVSMVIASFVFAGIYGVYTIQQRSYAVQEQVSEMQQRLRAAVQFMASEMRMAGYNPPNEYPDPNPYDPGGKCDGASILTMLPEELEFEFCRVTNVLDDNGDQKVPPEYKSEMVKTRYSLCDAYNNGVIDLCVAHDGGNLTPLAEGIEAIEFLYLDADGAVVSDKAGVRQIRISILARSSYPDRKYIDRTLYEPASVRLDPSADPWVINTGNPPTCNPDDPLSPCHYHRRLLVTTVKLRNMGLE